MGGSLIILLNELIKLNVNMNIIIKKVKKVELNKKTSIAIFNKQTFKMINIQVFCCNLNSKKYLAKA